MFFFSSNISLGLLPHRSSYRKNASYLDLQLRCWWCFSMEGTWNHCSASMLQWSWEWRGCNHARGCCGSWHASVRGQKGHVSYCASAQEDLPRKEMALPWPQWSHFGNYLRSWPGECRGCQGCPKSLLGQIVSQTRNHQSKKQRWWVERGLAKTELHSYRTAWAAATYWGHRGVDQEAATVIYIHRFLRPLPGHTML